MPPLEASAPGPILATQELHVYYGKVHAVQGVLQHVHPGEVVVILGAQRCREKLDHPVGRANAGGRRERSCFVDGASKLYQVKARVRLGMAYVPEGRRVLGDLSVHEKLPMGAYVIRDRAQIEEAC